MIFLDLEGTVINSELEPTLLPKHKEFLKGKEVIIFSSMFTSTDDLNGYTKSVLKSITDYFELTIIDICYLEPFYSSIKTNPSKSNLFLEYAKISCYTELTLLDDTVIDSSLVIEGKVVNFMRA